MKNKKCLIIVCAILAVALIIGGLAFAFSATGDSDNKKEENGEKEQSKGKTNIDGLSVVVLDGKYDDADYICVKEIRKVEVASFYEVVYVYLKGSNVRKKNTISLMVCNDKETFESQRKNDDKVFERYYDENGLAISYEKDDEFIYIGEKSGEVFVDMSDENFRGEMATAGFSCK